MRRRSAPVWQARLVARLLIVHHSPTPGLRALLDAAVAGTAAPGIEGVEVVVAEALDPDPELVAASDGYLLGTPANLGYMSGALKHWFDVVYNPSVDRTARRPYGCWVHGESDTTGAVAAIEKITTGLQWRAVQPPLGLIGPVDEALSDQTWELAATLAATLMDA
ncbi:MAG: flavodoxin [Acidimicrobiales bacterium]|nr:flavodoxin [Acidimicrobiales bacterium]